MKNRIYILAVLLFVSVPSFSQELLGYTTLWLCHNDNSTQVVEIVKSNKTSVHEGKVYQTLFDINNNEYYVRMEDSKLIRFNKGFGDFVLCDFSLNENDTFVTVDGRVMHVTECGDTIIRPKTNKKYHFLKLVNVEDAEDYDIWIEGYGSFRYSIFIPADFVDFKSSEVMFDINGVVNQFVNDFAVSQLMAVTKSEEGWLDEETMEVCYNPDSLHCEYKDGRLTISGRLFLNCGEKYIICEKQNGTVTFYVCVIPPHYACENSQYFNAELSMWLEDEDKLDYIQKGPDYVKQQFPIYSNHISSNISDFQNNQEPQNTVNNVIYDLSGRSLDQVPEHGIYIQGGKIILNRRK